VIDNIFAPDDTNDIGHFKEITGTTVDKRRGLDSVEIGAGTVSKLNSTTTALVSGGVFTGLGEDVSQFSTISVFVDSDIDGTLSMELSTDKINWDRKKVVSLDITLSTGSVHTLEVVSNFFRIVYTNSTGNGTQGHFRLQMICHKYRSGFLTSSPDQIISKINDAQIVRVSNDPFLDISRGLYSDKESIVVSAHNDAVPNGSFADIWSHGTDDAAYNWAATDEKFRARGGNANDTSAGSGARTLTIVYLDANGNRQTDTLTLAGTSVSDQTTFTGRRVLSAVVATAGTILSNNTGEILIENVTTGEVVCTIEAGDGDSSMSMFTVPLDFTAYLISVFVEVATGANKDADVIMWQRTNAYTTSAPFGGKKTGHGLGCPSGGIS